MIWRASQYYKKLSVEIFGEQIWPTFFFFFHSAAIIEFVGYFTELRLGRILFTNEASDKDHSASTSLL